MPRETPAANIHHPYIHLLHPPSNRIILRMQKHLLPPPFPLQHSPLHARHHPLHIPPHTRRPTHKHARPAPKPPFKTAQHEGDIRPSVLRAPALLLLRRGDGGQEGEAHEGFLEHGRRGGEAEVEGGVGGLGGDGEF